MTVEELAKELHEAGRAAVEAGQTVAAGNLGDQARKFLEWEEITEAAREGRRIQARYLLDRFTIARIDPAKQCHLDEGGQVHLPETCCIDDGKPHDCIFAEKLLRDGKGRDDCPHWGKK